MHQYTGVKERLSASPLVLANTWTHGMEKHGIAFRAVAAAVQYKMDNGAELFPVFAAGLMQNASTATNITSV
jgi:hypothetical protein